jgi:hypothetical protein
MEQIVKKAVKTGYGLGLLTLVEAKKVVARVKKELELNEKESLKLAKELVASSEKTTKAVLGTAKKHFENAVAKSGVISKKEFCKAKDIMKKRICKKICKQKTSLKDRIKKKVRRK